MDTAAGFRWFLLLALSLFGVTSAFELELEPSAVDLKNKKIGDNILVECRATGLADSSIVVDMQWWSASGELVPPMGHVSSSKNGQSAQLRILGANKQDEGEYRCVAKVNGEEKSTPAVIKLFEKITFRDAPEDQHPESNKLARIRCFVDPPGVSIVWLKDNKLLADDTARKYEFRDNNMVLEIPDFVPEKDDGTYVCQVVHTQAGTFTERYIKVSGHVAPTATLVGNATVTGKEGQDLKLRCGGNGRPEPELLWYKGTAEGELLTATDKYSIPEPGQLVIQSLTKNDVGTYTCVAKNEVAMDSRAVTVNVFLRARIEQIQNVTANINDNVVIDCKYTGDGIIRTYWTFRGEILTEPWTTPEPSTETEVEPLPVESRRIYVTHTPGVLQLHLDSIQMSDADEYQCEAANDAGADQKRVFLSVTHVPTIISFTDTSVRSFQDNQVSIFCEVEAVPAPTWTWKKPSGEEISSDFKTYSIITTKDRLKSTLTVSTKDSGDYGQYTCIAKNSVGEEHSRIRILEVVRSPNPTNVVVDMSHPSFANVSIGSFADLLESEQPLELIFLYATEEQEENEDFAWKTSAVRASLAFDPNNWYKIPGLTPETDYLIKVMAKNEAGPTEWSDELPYVTSRAKAPAAPVFERITDGVNELCENECTIQWERPEPHGAEIIAYKLVYREIEFVNGEPVDKGTDHQTIDDIPGHREQMMLYDLLPNTFYALELFAINEIGESPAGSMIVKTGELTDVKRGMSAGAIVFIVIIILLVVLAVLDVGCYFLNQCGLLMCFCVNCLGKTPPEVKEKSIAMEEGVKTDDKTPLREKEPEDKDDTEATPMVSKESNGVHNGHRATQV